MTTTTHPRGPVPYCRASHRTPHAWQSTERTSEMLNLKHLAAAAALTIGATAPAAGAHHVTRAQLEQMVADTFGPAAPTFRRIIACESSWDHRATHRNRNGTVDYGLLQLNSGGTLQSLGITPRQALDPLTNLRAAKRLYDRRGTRPWVCSRGRR